MASLSNNFTLPANLFQFYLSISSSNFNFNVSGVDHSAVRCFSLSVIAYLISAVEIEFLGSVGLSHVSYLTPDKSLGNLDYNSDQDVTYLYKVVPGISQRNFGFKVAELAQIPTSCIARATIMATKLEEVVNNRLAKSKSDEVEEVDGYTLVFSNDSPSTSNIDSLEDSNKAYAEFFSKLKFALLEEDHMKGFQLLKHARTIVEEILNC